MAVTSSGSSEARPAEDWAGDLGLRWLANIERFESMIASIGTALQDRPDFRPGEQVIDIGCGGGATSLAIASLIGPAGSVVGIDISPDLIARAELRSVVAGVHNVSFECADAAVYQPCIASDRLFSRFGSMFFPDPCAAFANLHRGLKPDGRIDMAVWGPPRDNVWMMEIMDVLKRYIEVPPATPRAPGAFAFEDRDYLTSVLAHAGFSGTDIVAHTGLQPFGGSAASPQEAVDFALSSLAAGRLLKSGPMELYDRVVEDLHSLFTRNYRPGEGVMLSAMAWLVSARA